MINKLKKSIENIYLALIIFLLYAPIVTLIVLSFNNTKTRSKWAGFTLDWYSSLFKNADIMNALYTTLIIALVSALVATVIGTMAAVGMQGMNKKLRVTMLGITNIPMLNADIVTGISLMLLFITLRVGYGMFAFEFTLGFTTVLLAHITFNIPYVILSVLPKLKQTSKRTYEAALDLGATPIQAFFKVVFPDIMPGIFTGFLLAFTMSLDDFVITHFTKGPGIDTLSTKIYSEVRKGVQPEMYALSTLLFVAVLFLLMVVNMSPKKKEIRTDADVKRYKRNNFIFQKLIPVSMVILITAGGIYYSTSGQFQSSEQVIIYNWGEYIDPDVIDIFQEETGIEVIYEEFETNEIMYPKVQAGSIAYDLACPSDYMIEKMINEDLLLPIDFDNIPNMEYIDPVYMEEVEKFDSQLAYTVPYCWGTVGILYNTTMVDEPIDSWSVLWDEKYKDSILMQDSVRDAFGITLKYLGYSLNSTDLDELNEAKNLLIEQKPLVQAYVIDQVRDKMIGGEAAIGVIYSGEALYTQDENEDLEYIIPKEGSNIWVDGWVIPKTSKNKENAEAFLNFLCRPDIAYMNFDYIGYATPNAAARDMIDDEDLKNNIVAFPSQELLENCEPFRDLGDDNNRIYNSLWQEVKSN